ncbi:MAG: hypothetical protein HUJ27_08400 [Rhodobacteraceae bacterium]|nr:hypothetical protein [Paracoccaceae bacterium]
MGFPQRSFRQHRNLLQKAALTHVARLADVSGMDPELATAAHQLFGCDIDILPLAPDGAMDPAASWPELHRATLIAQGVPEGQIRILRDAQAINRYDLITALGTFGVGAPMSGLTALLEHHLIPGGRLLVDIRKGSGGYPFLRDYGNSERLDRWDNDGKPVERVVMTSKGAGQWAEVARGLIGAEGFYRANETHSLTHIRRGETLCVTFDNLDIAMEKREDRRPWGYKFIEDQGWSMLAVMAGGWTWFRDPWVSAEFDRLRDEGFFDRFSRVIFYGASMGGYGALVFSAACPGAEVVVFSPQTVLDKALVPWETRYRVAWDLDYSDHYGDAARTLVPARRVNLFYDPYSDLDARHVARLSGGNLVHYRCPFFGHRLGTMLQQMGLLQPLVLKAMEGDLDPQSFHRLLRRRRDLRRWRKEMVERCLERGRVTWAEGLSRRFLKDGPDRFFQEVLDRAATGALSSAAGAGVD